MLLEQYVEEGFHCTVDWCPAFYRPAAPVVHFAGLEGLALHGNDFEFQKVWEVPLASSSQLMYLSRHVFCCLPVPNPSSWTHDVQEGKAQVDGIIVRCVVSTYPGHRLGVALQDGCHN